MFLSRLRPSALTARFVLFALAITGAGWTSLAAAHGSQHKDDDKIVFTIDVAEDFTLFNPTLVKPTDTQPERGSFFVTEGNIYPGGTIKGDGASFDPGTAGARPMVLPRHTPGPCLGDSCRDILGAHRTTLPASR